MIISQIAAMAKNRVIGNKGDLPWRLPEDLKYFKDKTKGHIIVMGRKTFESLPKPLPHRLNVVISRQKDYKTPEGVPCFGGIEEALEYCKTQTDQWNDEVFIVGGGEIYRQTLEQSQYLYLTEIDSEFEGDAKYPEIPSEFYRSQKEDRFEPMKYSFCTYVRRVQPSA